MNISKQLLTFLKIKETIATENTNTTDQTKNLKTKAQIKTVFNK